MHSAARQDLHSFGQPCGLVRRRAGEREVREFSESPPDAERRSCRRFSREMCPGRLLQGETDVERMLRRGSERQVDADPRRVRSDLQDRPECLVLLGATGMGGIVVCISVHNWHVDWVGPDWTMRPITGPCPPAVSLLATPGNVLLVSVHRAIDGAAWPGSDGGSVWEQGCRRYGPRCSASRSGSSLEEARDEDRQLALEDCCGSILDRASTKSGAAT